MGLASWSSVHTICSAKEVRITVSRRNHNMLAVWRVSVISPLGHGLTYTELSLAQYRVELQSQGLHCNGGAIKGSNSSYPLQFLIKLQMLREGLVRKESCIGGFVFRTSCITGACSLNIKSALSKMDRVCVCVCLCVYMCVCVCVCVCTYMSVYYSTKMVVGRPRGC